MGCFWGAERKFWEAGEGVYVTAVGYAGGFTPNPTYEETCGGRTGHTEAVLVVYDPKTISYERLLKIFWESHDPTQGMRQGNDVGTQYRSAIYATTPAQLAAARASAKRYGEALKAQGLWRDHHRDRRGRAVLLRRGLSPAISGEEPARLLRARRHRRFVPDRPGRAGGISRVQEKRGRLRDFLEAVADPRLGADDRGRGGIALDLGAQLPDEHPEILRVVLVRRAPYARSGSGHAS